MNRTFQARVGGFYWGVIAVSSALLFYLFWMHYTIAMLIMACVVIFEIEKLIHTQYVVTKDGILLIEGGRFVPKSAVPVGDIISVSHIRSFSFWNASLSLSKLEIRCNAIGKKSVLRVSPKNEADFIKCLQKYNPSVRAI